MSTRITRGAMAKEAALLAAVGKENIPRQLSSPPASPISKKGARCTTVAAKNPLPPTSKKSLKSGQAVTVASAGEKRKRTAAVKLDADEDELPHGLGKIIGSAGVKAEDVEDETDPSSKFLTDNQHLVTKEDVADIKQEVEKVIDANAIVEASPTKKAKRTKKDNIYGVRLGETPYPDHIRPTQEECQEVNDILSKAHGAVRMPEAIPLPSLTVAGCGEVPCVLEALMRTLLSAHTSNGNAAKAIQGLIKRFGVLKGGVGQGSLDWNAVRLAKREDIFEAIKRGGLAKTKSAHIEKIVTMVYEENQALRIRLAEKASDANAQPFATGEESETDLAVLKAAKTMLSDPNVLTLDYFHAMPANEAFTKFLTYPGIGVKTASCTLLFCMQRPSFAVDTHVFRLCKWLGWVPEKATRDTTFAHCDVRIPNDLKYSLHQLLIKHGKTCGRCRAITGESSVGWEKGCVIDQLVRRTGARKGGIAEVKTKKVGTLQKGSKKGKKDDIDSEDDVREDVKEESPRKRKTPAKAKTETGFDISTKTSRAAATRKKILSKRNSTKSKSKKPPLNPNLDQDQDSDSSESDLTDLASISISGSDSEF